MGTKSRLDDFTEKGLVDPSRIRSFLRGEVLVSQLGLGTYRLHPEIPEHHAAVGAALCSGVNLVETAPNYTFEGAETLIGGVLEALGGKQVREQFVLVAKGGFIQGPGYQRVKEKLREGAELKGLVPYSEGCWYSMDPDFLEKQFQESLQRLGVSAVDVFLIHNPETDLQWHLKEGNGNWSAIQEDFYQRMEKAFVWLEEKAEEGQILYYGVSSNHFHIPEQDPAHLSLESLLNCAGGAVEKVTGEGRARFQVVQFPLNPLEMRGTRSVLELAASQGLDVLINRPLNAMAGQRVYRLARRRFEDDVDYESIVTRSLRQIEAFETEFREKVGNPGETGFHLFKVGGELRDTIHQLEDSDHLHELMNFYFLGHTQRSVDWLQENGNPSLSHSLEAYLQSWEDLEIALHGKLNRDDFSKTLKILGSSSDFLMMDSLDLSAGVIRFLMSFPSKPIILNGMRSPAQVKSSTEALIYEDHPNFQELREFFQEHSFNYGT